MAIIYKNIKNSLTNFFLKQENYKKTINLKSNAIYFYSSANSINVIKLSDSKNEDDNDLFLEDLLKKMKSSIHHKPSFLNLVVNENLTNEFKKDEDGSLEIIGNFEFIKEKLQEFFPSIMNINAEKTGMFSKKPDKEKDDDDGVGEFDTEKITKTISTLLAKAAPNKILFTWFCLAVSVLVPIVWFSLSIMYHINKELNWNSPPFFGMATLFSGGTTVSLTIDGGQWWRIFTYGFAIAGTDIMTNLIVTGFGAVALYSSLKFAEITIKKWKLIFVLILGYVITGFFSTVMLQGAITGGILNIAAITIGMLIMSVASDPKITSKFIKAKMIWPIILLIFIPFMINPSLELYFALGVGLVSGTVLMALVMAVDKKSTITSVGSLLVILTLIIVPIIFIFVRPYTEPTDPTVLQTLQVYIKNNMLSASDADAIVAKIGWDRHFWK
ncbi:hypothetical protein ELUMI_v1c04420 [Williamsoniiplasma luminosum]|uniref:Rhomboid family intramembrane serine protease n=1 Tax=Williamsoniiplasma luminosum TaxID=214888 RepID=A0A2K8NUE7_9MOLU|nr:hypothetical protein [Williamsoniiplasma luminosum]ATZ17166.1 hypothetical protein ELUMI_v1c04420 [Williamsoniiplasma luminosum]